ncbi:hypothetical protein E2C01_008941 [Portunus trituberculatus]|uniref:Uncharacterized protein n=1 Tax=Portunus trituberculatus TaxID=210409 RepID=A0A5B7D3C0_PORTR|nr:hypothetical protein [Portunus trituberculatus]
MVTLRPRATDCDSAFPDRRCCETWRILPPPGGSRAASSALSPTACPPTSPNSWRPICNGGAFSPIDNPLPPSIHPNRSRRAAARQPVNSQHMNTRQRGREVSQ